MAALDYEATAHQCHEGCVESCGDLVFTLYELRAHCEAVAQQYEAPDLFPARGIDRRAMAARWRRAAAILRNANEALATAIEETRAARNGSWL